MSARRWVEGACVLVILLGVGLKVMVSRQEGDRPPPPVQAQAEAFLARQGFTPAGSATNLDLVLLEADKGPACHLTLAIMAPQGWHGGVVQTMQSPGEDLFYVFNGATYEEQPVMRSRLRLYGTLLLRRMGFEAALHPLFGVIAPPACKARDLPWQDLSRLSAAAPGG